MGWWHSGSPTLRIVAGLSVLFLVSGCATIREKTNASATKTSDHSLTTPAAPVAPPVSVPEVPQTPVAKAPAPLPPGVPALWPVKEDTSHIILSSYGYRGSRRGGPGSFHRAVDIKAAMNAPVVATANGIVAQKSSGGDYGKMLVLDHQNGYKSVYAHLNDFKVEQGQQVAEGEIIGLAGQTGNATCTHVHYEVRKNEEAVNPAQFLPMEDTRIEKLATLVPATGKIPETSCLTDAATAATTAATTTATATALAATKSRQVQLAKSDDDQYDVPVDNQVKTKTKKSSSKSNKARIARSNAASTKSNVRSTSNNKSKDLGSILKDKRTAKAKVPVKLSTTPGDKEVKITKSSKSDTNPAAATKKGKTTTKSATKTSTGSSKKKTATAQDKK